MKFAILGPIRVLDGDRDITPSRAKLKALLTVLLLDRNEVVPSDRLVEALWGESPPATALTALHGHVSALRKLLGPERIETHPPGYRMRIQSGELDVATFQSLVTEARLQQDSETRVQRLKEALGQWRGDPLADFRYEAFAQGEITRLAEMRRAALEDRIDADLELGRHHELVGELESLVLEHPLRERLRAQLMLALYRCGRGAEALHVFQEGRKELASELGIDPGPALRVLQDQILTQNASLDIEPPEEADEVAEGRDDRHRIELIEERKLATILFADVSSSAALEESIDPERLGALMTTYHAEVSDVTSTWGGTFERYAGDAIVAVFGVPSVREDDAERAVRAALEIVERVENLNRSFRERHGITLAVRIGINTGEVISSGGAGDQPLVAGDVVKMAARLGQTADDGMILVGDRTYLMTRRTFRFAEASTPDLNGREPAVVHAVRGWLRHLDQPPARLETPFVGRGREIARLTGSLDEVVASRTPHLMLVYGTAGIGKSRLTREFVGIARESHPSLLVLKGRCLAAGRGITYWALGEILREAFGIALNDGVTSAAGRLWAGARRVLSGLGLADDELDRSVFALATTAGIALPNNPLDQTEPRAVADELARAWPRLATGLATKQPTVLLIEDLHWAGEQLIEMLERLTARAEGPLLVIATARPEFAEAHTRFGAGREGITTVSLQPFSEAEADSLMAGVLGSVRLPEEMRAGILRMAEGNPFFLEEIILRLIDSGAITREEDRWTVPPDAAPISLPDTVHGVLAARMDSLPAVEKRVLQEAAVVGRVFWEASLARVMPEQALRVALLGLEDKGLVTARPTSSIGGQAEFQFKHALVREVAYTGLPKVRRARAHAECASWLEELAGDRLDEFIELVAHHYRLAVAGEDADLAWAGDARELESLRARAFEVLLSAGTAARRRFAISKAIEIHEQALGLASDDLERATALADIGEDHEVNFHGDEALEAYGEALALVRSRPEAISLRARICLMAGRMAAVKWGIFRSEPTPSAVEQLIDEGFEAATDDETRNWLMVLKGTLGLRWLWWQYESDESAIKDPLPLSERIRYAEEGVETAERLDRPALLSLAYRTLGLLQSLAGSWGRTVEIARRDLLLANQLEPSEKAFALFFNAIFLMEIEGEYLPSLPHAEHSLEIARGLTRHELMHGTYTVMNALYHLGQWEGLDALAREHAEALNQEQGIGCPYSRVGPVVAATALAHQGRLDQAAEFAATLTPNLDRPALPEALLARYLVARGDAEAGLELSERILGRSIYAEENSFEVLAKLDALVALEDWSALTDFLPHARSFSEGLALIGPASDRAEGMVRAASGERDTAEDLFRRALSSFERMGVAFEAALTKEQLATVTSVDDAVRLRKEALAVYERLGAEPHAERMRAALA
jgi:DNA-binding SARP family transcriptional activator/tetratricopeptide (TPR) repeat protein